MHISGRKFIIIFAATLLMLVAAFLLYYFIYFGKLDRPEYLAECIGLIPVIEKYKKSEGIYPLDASHLPLKEKLLANKCGYSRNQEHFYFNLGHGWFGVAFYSSKTGEWHLD